MTGLSNKESDIIADATKLFVADIDLHLRSSQDARAYFDLDRMASQLSSLGDAKKVVYTAFDGDHQQLCGLMRAFVLDQGAVPANPDSILDYRETVLSRLTKEGVLLDDLAVLRGCDELWVFTDAGCSLEAIHLLAEGVLVELLYFLKRRRDSSVCFISISELMSQGSVAPITLYAHSYEDTKCALAESQKSVLKLANSGMEVDLRLPKVTYSIIDPLDFKYARWLLPRSKASSKLPLVPNLAVQPSDFIAGGNPIGVLLPAWIALMRIGTCCQEISSSDSSRTPSYISQLMMRIWLRNRSVEIHQISWGEFNIPKARNPQSWPLTDMERLASPKGNALSPRLVQPKDIKQA